MADEIKKVPPCVYNKGVGCPLKGRRCQQCGFNPSISYKRIKEKYGVKNTKYLSAPGKKG